MTLAQLDQMINTVCPIYGISSDGRIDFRPEATQQQMDDAQAIMDANISNLVLTD